MRKTLLIMRQELITTLKRKTYLFFAIGLPLILGIIALVFLIANRDDPQSAVSEPEPEPTTTNIQGYIDQAGLVASPAPGLPEEALQPFPDETAARQALEAGQIDGYFIIPPDYLTGAELTYVTAEFNPFQDSPNDRPIEWLLLTNLLDDPAQAAAVWQPLNLTVTKLTPIGSADSAPEDDGGAATLLPTIMVLIIYMTIIIPAGALVNAVADEKKNRVIESVLVSVSSRQFITGKILALGLLGLLQIAMWLGIIYAVVNLGGTSLNLPPGLTVEPALLVWVIIYSLLGYAMYGVLMAGLGALVPDVKDARSASLIILVPLIVAYMFNILVLELPNSPVALFLSLFPLTAPVSMVGRMAITAIPAWQGLLSAVLQLGAAILLLLLVARLFQAKYMLSGQPFNVKNYFLALAGRI